VEHSENILSTSHTTLQHTLPTHPSHSSALQHMLNHTVCVCVKRTQEVCQCCYFTAYHMAHPTRINVKILKNNV